jgi:5-methylcytosine-specific restriction endonuclease McrA
MSILGELKKELAERGRKENLRVKDVCALQFAYVKENPKCEICGNTKNINYDHIIPKQILANFNIDATRQFWEENSRTLCFSCNHRKSNNLDFNDKRTKELLIKLIDNLE